MCTRFGVDRSPRVKHGALIDAQLLAQVYVELTGGRQIGLGLVADRDRAGVERGGPDHSAKDSVRPRARTPASEEEVERHASFLAKIDQPVCGGVSSQ